MPEQKPLPQSASVSDLQGLRERRVARPDTPSAEQLAEFERLVSLCEVQAIRSGMPLPLGAHPRGNGVHFAFFSRHASGVRLDLFDHPEDATPVRSIIFNAARNKTGDIWHVWLEGIRPGQLYGFRVAGTYAPREGHRFNPDKLVMDPYTTAIASLPGCDFRLALGYDPSSPQKDLSFSEVDDAATAPKCVVTHTDFDWQGDQPLRHAWESTVTGSTLTTQRCLCRRSGYQHGRDGHRSHESEQPCLTVSLAVEVQANSSGVSAPSISNNVSGSRVIMKPGYLVRG